MRKIQKINGSVIFISIILLVISNTGLAQSETFSWPQGKKMALSLSFDDARTVQLTTAIPLLDEYGVKATFFLVSSSIEQNLQGWKDAVKEGHEMGNHTFNHPCGVSPSGSGGSNRLENKTLGEMKKELLDANSQIKKLLGVTPKVFAYPCGQTYVGRGENTKSYVPLVAKYFLAGRGWLGESPNDPLICNFSQLSGMTMGDEMPFEKLLPILQSAAKKGQWVILVGHDVGKEIGRGHLDTRISTLKKLCEYAADPKNDIWIAPIGTIAEYVKSHKAKTF